MIQIDGSLGEGGGQVLRSSLALSLLTGRAVRLFNIRAGRAKPGLKRQHLTGVRAAGRVGLARVQGDALNSQEVIFEPQTIQGGHHHFKVGTAGSTGLVFQTVLPALLKADGPSTVIVEGGTHASMAPPFDFLERVFVPALRRMGAQVDLRLESYGFNPAGGGRIVADITPAPLRPMALLHRGAITRRSITAYVSNLPTHIGQREVDAAKARLGWDDRAECAVQTVRSPGPGNAFMIELSFEHGAEIFSGFGSRGRRAEQLACVAADEALAWLATDVPVSEHLADQLLLPMVLAGGGTFRTVRPTRHTTTQLDTIGKFVDTPIKIEPEDGNACRITVGA
jgi:RNA 3'-terminal phosphate cyclase (ATP)